MNTPSCHYIIFVKNYENNKTILDVELDCCLIEALESIADSEGWGASDVSACWLAGCLLLLGCWASWTTAVVRAASGFPLFSLVRGMRGPAWSLSWGPRGLLDPPH